MNQIPSEFVIDENPQTIWISGQILSISEQIAALIQQRAELSQRVKKGEQQTNRQQQQLFLRLLEVTDAFDRIFQGLDLTGLNEIARNLVGSFRTTNILLEYVLAQEEVVSMEGLEGKKFDPHTQEVIDVEIKPTQPEGLILEVAEKGYHWHDKVLRRAKVIVSKKTK